MLYALAWRAILTFEGSWTFSRALNLRTCCCHAISIIQPPSPPRSASTPHGAHLAGAAPSFQKPHSSPLTVLPKHQLGGVQSVLMLSQQLPKCNNYGFFFFSSNVRWQSRGLGVVVKKRMHSESERKIQPFGIANVHIPKREMNQSGFWKHCCGCQEMQRWYLLSFSLSLCVEALYISHL